MTTRKLREEVEINKKITQLKRSHEIALRIMDGKVKYLQETLDKTRAKYRELQRRNDILHSVKSKLERKIELHKQTLSAISNSLAVTENKSVN